MILTVAKSTSINLRVSPLFRSELQQLADYRGLTLSSLAHSLLVKALRQEKRNEPEAFTESERLVNADFSPQIGIAMPEEHVALIPNRRKDDAPLKKKNRRVP